MTGEGTPVASRTTANPGAVVSVADGDEDREVLMSGRTSVIDPQFL